MNATVKEFGKKLIGLIPDKIWLSYWFKRRLGYKMDWKNPKTFNQKLQWLKVYDRKPIYTTMVDKYEVKKYVADIIGEEYIIPTLGVWNSFDEIDFDKLPDQFVLKCTHDSGGLIIVKDKSELDVEKARKLFSVALKRNPYSITREWPYKNVKPRIIAEQYMEDSTTNDLRDYKIFAFDGVAKALFIATERDNEAEETKFDFFDMEYKHLPFTNGHPNASTPPAKPQTFDEMKTLAEKLSKNIPQLRVDFYEVNGKAYFGELTFFHWGGMKPFDPAQWDETFGSWITLPENFGGGGLLLGNGYVIWLHSSREKQPLNVYKIFNFSGTPKIIQTIQNDKQPNESIDYFTTKWERLELKQNFPNSEILPAKPRRLEEMLALSEKLSDNRPFIRTDFYEVNGRVYFSELTFFSDSGTARFEPKEWDKILGDCLLVPTKQKLQAYFKG